MSSIIKSILKVVLEIALGALKTVEWKPVAYEVLMEQLIPYLEKKVADTSSSIDDKAVDFAKNMIEKYLKPKAE